MINDEIQCPDCVGDSYCIKHPRKEKLFTEDQAYLLAQDAWENGAEEYRESHETFGYWWHTRGKFLL